MIGVDQSKGRIEKLRRVDSDSTMYEGGQVGLYAYTPPSVHVLKSS